MARQNPPGYMTTFGERLSYWTYFVGQNAKAIPVVYHTRVIEE